MHAHSVSIIQYFNRIIVNVILQLEKAAVEHTNPAEHMNYSIL